MSLLLLSSEFSGPLPGDGGLVVLDGGTVRGSDSQFLYSGAINEAGNALTATVPRASPAVHLVRRRT